MTPHPILVAEYQLRAAAPDIEDQKIGVGWNFQRRIGANGSVCQLRLTIAGDDLYFYSGSQFSLGQKFLSVSRIAQGTCSCPQNLDGTLPPGVCGKSFNGFQSPFHCGLRKSFRGIYPFTQTCDFRDLGDDREQAVAGHIGDGHL